MTDSSPLANALQDDAAATALAGILIDFALDLPTSTIVTPEHVLNDLDKALDERLTERNVQKHLRPAIDREIARARTRGDTVGDWFTAEAKAELRSLVARPIDIPHATVERWVKRDEVRRMVRSAVQDTLESFIDTVKPGGSGGGAVGAVGRRAFGFAKKASGGVLGSIGSQIEGQLKRAVNSFLANNLEGILDKAVRTATSAETKQRISKEAVRIFDRAMKLKGEQVAAYAEKLPWDDLLEALPGQLAHNLSREAIRDGIKAEVQAFLDVDADTPFRGMFADDAAVEAWRAEAIPMVAPLLAQFWGSEAAAAWWMKYLPA